MYLKSIDLVGYKSFAAKTHLDLEPGITGIIGPNGCGKSNIMESVRWCLGEMSWKSLRAGAMIDVIFSGTAKRAPLSMTEVTLTFDNAESLLPVQFSEVVISRRIYRSGESAYFLNKTQCRLRDIRELFLDTGVGGDGYAIIDQGGVDFVLSSKPEDRRSIFEEAAGVAKYKAKREEALRKLERVEMDMGRLQDSASLISEQVRKLDSDARKAKLYKKHKEELAAMEAAHILQEVAAMEAELSAAAAEVAPLQETLGRSRVEADAEGANLAALNLERAAQQSRVIESNQRLSEVKSGIGRLEERVQSSQRSIADLEERSKAADKELAAAAQRLGAIDPEIERASLSVAESEAARGAAEKESEAWNGELARLEESLRGAQSALEGLKGDALAAAQKALDLRRALSEAESAWSREESQLRSSLRELEKDSSRVESSGREIEVVRLSLGEQGALVASAAQRAAEGEADLAGARLRQQEISDRTVALHAELAETRARLESLEAQGGQDPYWAGAQAVLNAGIEGILGSVSQLVRVEEAYKPYLEDALGERLHAVVCEDSSAARAGVELLEASGKGRARFLVLSSLPSAFAERAYPEQARPMMRHVQYDPRHEKAVRYLLEESYALGKALFADHWVSGGSAERQTLQLRLADIGPLRDRLGSGQARAEELSEAKAACEAAIAAAELSLREALAAGSREAARESSLKAQLAEKESAQALCVSNADLSTSESARLLSELAMAKESNRELRARLAQAAGEESSAREREAQALRWLASLRDELTKGQATREVLKSRLQGLEQQLTFLAGAYERLAEEKKGHEASVLRRRQELEDYAARGEESRLLAERSRQELSELRSRLAGLEGQSQGVFSRLQEIEKAASEKEAVLRGLKEECDAAQERLHQFELAASGRRATQEALKKRLWEEWQLAFEEARAKYEGHGVDAEKLESLRKRIANMGNINMAAPEEYEALSSRQAFLASQIEDLTKAKEDLRAAISKINNATRENFRQTFTEVREHFRRLYGVLFEGGEADLVLTNPDDILETGVEIVAQPPGKRLQSISLLSGGEKTLTAIALLFAFFMVKPSPFCMLDEADAALDDANVERFVGLLREFQSRTQFLIVSHNKRTMEAADVIYGVTMEEMGVSQLISVDFRGKSAGRKSAAAGAAAGAPEAGRDELPSHSPEGDVPLPEPA